MQDGDPGKDRSQRLGIRAEPDVEPVRDDRIGDKAAAERVHREQRREAQQRAQGTEGRLGAVGFDARREEQRKGCSEHADRRIKKEEGARVRGECGAEPSRRVEQAPDQRIAPERSVAGARRHGFGEHRLLDGRERAEVDARGAEHSGHSGQDQERWLSCERKVEPGERYQETGGRERCAAAETGREGG